MNRLFALILLATTSTAFASGGGWTVGAGVVSSDVVDTAADAPFFPYFRDNNKQYMLIPNLSFQWDAWSIGADGIGWEADLNPTLKTQIKVGYPRSQWSLSGQRGWFRYGLNTALSYADGVTATQGITLGPVSCSATVGFDERSDDFSQKGSLGFPLYLNQKAGITVIGSAYVQQDNAAFTRNDLSTTAELNSESYVHPGVNVFSVYQVSPKFTVLLSGTFQWNDADLVSEVPNVPNSQFNIFTMFSYSFGR